MISCVYGTLPEGSKPHPEIARLFVGRDGSFWRAINKTHPERPQWAMHKLSPDKDGYLRFRAGGRSRFAHREVYLTFVGALKPGLVVCHLDNDPTNNAPCNLLQDTQAVNISHKRAHGTHQSGERHPRALAANDAVAKARVALQFAPRSETGRLKRGEAQKIASQCGLSVHVIRDLSAPSKKAWSHV